MLRTATTAFLALVLALPALAQTDSPSDASSDAPSWLRHPAISPDGQTLAFSYQGDLYTVPTSGGVATALTTYDGYDAHPVWSRDGQTLAFASDRYGGLDVFTMPARGGAATRLTYHSAADYPSDFAPDGSHVLFTSVRRDDAQASGFPSGSLPELYSVPVAGGRPSLVLTTPAQDARYTPDGAAILFHDRKGYEDEWRKKHTSSITRDVWRYDTATGQYTRLANWTGEDRNPAPAPDGSGFFYLSEESNGVFNVHFRPYEQGAAPEAVSSFETHPVRFLSIAEDGTLAYSWDGELYTQRRGQEPQKVAVEIRREMGERMTQNVPVTSGAREMAVSPSGKEIAFVYRGEVFVTSVETATTKQITNTPEQERSVSFHPEGKTLLYAAERDGSWNLYETKIAREGEPYFYAATLLEETPLLISDAETFQPAYSPDGESVAFLSGRTEVRVIDRESKSVRTVLPGSLNFSYGDGDQHFAWSPDSKWLLVEFLQPGYWQSEVGLVPASGGAEPVNLTLSGYPDYAPQWMMNGKMVLWYSSRDGLRAWSGSGGAQADVYATFLTQENYDRFRLSKEDFELLEEQEKAAQKKDSTLAQAAKADTLGAPIEMDLDGVEDRRVRLTLFSSRLGGAAVTPDGKTLVYLARTDDDYDLWKTDLRTRETSVLAELGSRSGAMEMSPDGKYVYVLSGGSLSRFEVASGKRKGISYRGEMALDAAAERAHIFEHAVRQVEDKFYDPSLHGADWQALAEDYRRHLPHVANGYDFADLLGELLGELNASHTGARYRHRAENPDATASLGLFYDERRDGAGLRVAEVMEGGPLDTDASEVKAGVVIEQIDGVAITSEVNHHRLLNRKAGDRVRLALYDPASEKRWEEVVKPISFGAESSLRYDRWVDQRRAIVDSLSGGRLGYVHVRGMNDASYRTVIEEVLGRHVTKEGLVVDTRFNGGGDLVDDLATFLGGERYADFISPDGRVIGSESQRKWTRPSVMLATEGNYSDAHCTPWAYQELGVGPVIGMPVPGTCTFVWWESQQDGQTVFGIPNMAMTDGQQRPLENQQLMPDVLVDNPPGAVARGEDPQLAKAVEVLLGLVKTGE
jgi:Tol biopolymer transport system component